MIWLEEREVEVNGQKAHAVYPVLYTKNTNGLRLTAGGSLISAKNIIVETKETLQNAGTLYGENILIKAGNMDNTGWILEQQIGLKSERDTASKSSRPLLPRAPNNCGVGTNASMTTTMVAPGNSRRKRAQAPTGAPKKSAPPPRPSRNVCLRSLKKSTRTNIFNSC